MTIKEAEHIAKILECRKELMSELRDLDQCKSITGHINDGVNGLGFGWAQGSRQLKYLIEGTKAELARVEEVISKYTLAGGE
jgi:hypothetical protein